MNRRAQRVRRRSSLEKTVKSDNLEEALEDLKDLAGALQLMALGLEARGIEEGKAFSAVAEALVDRIPAKGPSRRRLSLC